MDMQQIWTIIATVAITASITWVVQSILGALRQGGKKVRAAREKKARQEMEAIIKEAIKPLRESIDTIRYGTQAGLRHTLLVLGNMLLERGFATYEEIQDFENMYESYHALGKNGVMDHFNELVMALPIKEN